MPFRLIFVPQNRATIEVLLPLLLLLVDALPSAPVVVRDRLLLLEVHYS